MKIARSAKAPKRASVMLCALAACESIALGGATFSNSSTVKWTFDPDTSGGSQIKTINVNPPPASGGMPVPPAYQLNQTFTSGNASSTAKGSLGYVVNPTTATFTLAPGTGVTQSDPSNQYPGDSLLRVDFDGFFNPTAPGFGPPATGYVSIAVGGIVGAGGKSQFKGQVQFLNGNNSAALRPTVNFDQTFNTAGNFAKTFTSSGLLAPSTIPVGTPVRVKGFFEFRASNHFSPSSILPLDIEFGGAPPTATYYGKNNGDWSRASNWTAPAGSEIDDPDHTIPTIPNGAGQRARFITLDKKIRNINLDRNITLGALDLGSLGNFSIDNCANFGLTLDAQAGNSSIHSRNLAANVRQSINTNVMVTDGLDIVTDGAYVPGEKTNPAALLHFNRSINGQNGAGIQKFGEGHAVFNSKNNYLGGTKILGGELSANSSGALGSGNVLATDGQLNYNARRAAAKGIDVSASNGGQIDLGIEARSDERFAISGFSAISGSAKELKALTNGTNLLLRPGAMISHESWDTNPTKNNPKNLGTSPQYIFGISNDFTSRKSQSLTFGSDSGTPWVGFGSDRSERTFGTNPNTAQDVLNVKGKADLVSLHSLLTLNGQLVSADGSSSLNKSGKGAAAIDNHVNDFHAPILAAEGALLVNGTLRDLPSLDVSRDATLGGLGVIDGPVSIRDGGILAPGHIKPTQKIGTLTVGDLFLGRESIINFDLGTTGIVGQGINDLVIVQGDLRLGGVLNVTDTGNFSAAGIYTLFEVQGDTTNLGLTIGSVPDGSEASISILPGIGEDGSRVVLNLSGISIPAAPVPEPGGICAGLTLAGIAALARRERRVRP